MSLMPVPRRERVHGRVEPPGVLVEAEPAQHLELELLLQVERERARRAALGVARRSATSLTSGAWCSFR